MRYRYWVINFIGHDGFSLCVSTSDLMFEDEVIDLAIANGVIDMEDVEDFQVNVEDITEDVHKMRFWVSLAQYIE